MKRLVLLGIVAIVVSGVLQANDQSGTKRWYEKIFNPNPRVRRSPAAVQELDNAYAGVQKNPFMGEGRAAYAKMDVSETEITPATFPQGYDVPYLEGGEGYGTRLGRAWAARSTTPYGYYRFAGAQSPEQYYTPRTKMQIIKDLPSDVQYVAKAGWNTGKDFVKNYGYMPEMARWGYSQLPSKESVNNMYQWARSKASDASSYAGSTYQSLYKKYLESKIDSIEDNLDDIERKLTALNKKPNKTQSDRENIKQLKNKYNLLDKSLEKLKNEYQKFEDKYEYPPKNDFSDSDDYDLDNE